MTTTTRKTVRSLVAVSLMSILIGACGPSSNDARQSAESASPAPAAMTAVKVPITTSSEEARDFYLKGQALVDDLLIVDAHDLFLKAVAADDEFAMGHFMVASTALSTAEFFDSVSMASARASGASDGEQLYIQALAAGANADQAAQRAALEKLMGLYPKDERTHVALANFLNGQQDFAGASAHFGHAIAIAPDFASAHNSLGYAHRSLDDFDSARTAFEKYVELVPDQPNPYDSLAELLMEMGNYDESIASYRKALEINPNFAASYAGITINHSLKGEADQALDVAEEMLAAARNFAERQGAMFRSVTSHIFAGNTESAMEVCETMIAEALEEGDHSTMGGVTEYMGDIAMASGDAKKAREYFDAALQHRMQANLSEANIAQAKRTHLFKTAIAAMVGDDDEAAVSRTAEYAAAAEAHGTNFETLRVHELSGYLAMSHEDNETASADFDKASQLQPVALYWAAIVNRDLGNMDKARDLANRAANRNTLNPNLPFFRANAVELLAELSGG